MKYDPNKRVPDQLRDIWLTTKEDVLIWLKGEMERVTDQSRMDKKHSAAFYYAYTKLLTRFYKKIEDTVLFNRLEDFWHYTIGVSSAGAVLSLCYLDNYKVDENSGTLTLYGPGQEIPIISIQGRYLSVEEYASEYGVGAGTVRQWIRRGKIRTAIKTGKEWIIPELTELPDRGYQSATYFYNGNLPDLPEEYEFLNGYTVIIINQNREDRGKFDVMITDARKAPVSRVMGTKEREKLELFLISRPDVRYIEGPMDGLNVQISTKDFKNEWIVS